MIYVLSHIALSIALLLTVYLGIRLVKVGGRHTRVGYGMFILAIGFLIRNIFDFYGLYAYYYWILPEALLLSGAAIITYGITGKGDEKYTK